MPYSRESPFDSVHYMNDPKAIYRARSNSVKDWLRNHPEKHPHVEIFLGDRKEFVSVREYLADF